MLSGRFEDIIPGNPHLADVAVEETDPGLTHLVQGADKHPPSVLRLAGLNADTLAEVALVVSRAQEQAVDPGRRDFQGIAPGHGVMRVKQVAQLPMNP